VKVADVLRASATIDKIRFPDRHHFRHRNFVLLQHSANAPYAPTDSMQDAWRKLLNILES
jgi:hypothetical protein